MLAPYVLLERGGIRHVLFTDNTVLGKVLTLLRGKAQTVRRSLQLHCLSSRELDHNWAQSSRQANFLLSHDSEHHNLEEDLAVLRMCHGSSPVRKFGL